MNNNNNKNESKQYPTKLDDMNFKTEFYHQGWESAFQYVYDVLNGIRNASKSEKAFCQRFIDDLQREDLKLNLTIYNFVVVVANSLKHTKGPIGGKPILLMPWQHFVLLNLFCWYYNENAHEQLRGLRRFTKAFVFLPRGNAKTQLAAIVSICSLLLTENKNPIVTTSASSRKQATICFDEIKGQIKSSTNAIKSKFSIRANDILLKRGGSIFPTSSEADSLDGHRITTAVLDEVHAHKNRDVHDAIASSQSSSKDPILFMITTAGTNVRSFCKEMYDYSKGLLFDEFQNDQFLSIIYESDIEEFDSTEGFEQANPSLGHAVSLQSLRSKAQEAGMSEAAMSAFCVKHINRWYSYAENGLISQSLIDVAFQGPFPNDVELSTMKSYMGFDLGATSDLTSLVSVFIGSDGTLYAKSKNFIPEAAYDALPSNYTRLYTQALNSGSLFLAGELVTDLEEVADTLNQMKDTFKPKEIGIDAANWGPQFAKQFRAKYRRELVAVPQGYGLSSAAITFIRLMAEGKIKFSPNDTLMKWCIENARVREGQAGDIAVIKSSNYNLKIDACIALLIALSIIPVVEKSVQVRTL
ncbi:terminase large subunit [Aeromonas caviae]|uniref:terminase large subunit n=1 Tax=Aeromonas caviae TaxID=648 RepID=UPI003F747D28